LAGEEMAEGAREGWGLAEWDLARNWNVREGLRFLAEFTAALRQKALGAGGLPFTEMPLAQQQRFLAVPLNPAGAGAAAVLLTAPLQSLEEFAGAALRVEYTQPGGYRWQPSRLQIGYPAVVPVEPGPRGRLALLPSALGRTREEALQAARRIDPRLREGLMRVDPAHLEDPSLPVTAVTPQEAEISPTTLDLWLLYFLGPTSARPSLTHGLSHNFYQTRKGWE